MGEHIRGGEFENGCDENTDIAGQRVEIDLSALRGEQGHSSHGGDAVHLQANQQFDQFQAESSRFLIGDQIQQRAGPSPAFRRKPSRLIEPDVEVRFAVRHSWQFLSDADHRRAQSAW